SVRRRAVFESPHCPGTSSEVTREYGRHIGRVPSERWISASGSIALAATAIRSARAFSPSRTGWDCIASTMKSDVIVTLAILAGHPLSQDLDEPRNLGAARLVHRGPLDGTALVDHPMQGDRVQERYWSVLRQPDPVEQ